MTNYEKALVFNGIAVILLLAGTAALLVAGAILLPWWPAKVACVIGLVWYVFRKLAAFYANR